MHITLSKVVFFILLVISVGLFEEVAPLAKIAEHSRIFLADIGFEWVWDKVFPPPGPVVPPVPATNVAVTTDRIGTSVDETGTMQGEGYVFDTTTTQLGLRADYSGAQIAQGSATKLSASLLSPNGAVVTSCTGTALSVSSFYYCNFPNLSLTPGQYYVVVYADGVEKIRNTIQVTPAAPPPVPVPAPEPTPAPVEAAAPGSDATDASEAAPERTTNDAATTIFPGLGWQTRHRAEPEQAANARGGNGDGRMSSGSSFQRRAGSGLFNRSFAPRPHPVYTFHSAHRR